MGSCVRCENGKRWAVSGYPVVPAKYQGAVSFLHSLLRKSQEQRSTLTLPCMTLTLECVTLTLVWMSLTIVVCDIDIAVNNVGTLVCDTHIGVDVAHHRGV